MKQTRGTIKTLLLTIVALLAFAANSLLCRLALGQQLIDGASFTAIRMLSGALLLGLIVLPRWRASGRAKVDLLSTVMLFTYMVFFRLRICRSVLAPAH